MSFSRVEYMAVYDFAEKVFMGSVRSAPEIAQEAEMLMDMCEDVIGQIRPEGARLNSGKYSRAALRKGASV